MPIRTAGTPEHAHFKGIYEQIRQVVRDAGLDIIRADEVAEEGAIVKDVLERIARSTIVIADLTDLNPNVFWELGVRHTLRAAGTILLIDEARSEPPFDLSYLRLLKYRGTVEGLSDLRDQLTTFLGTTLVTNDEATGSPVHQWLGHLPPDLSVATSELEGSLRTEVSEYREQLHRYARRFGSLDGQEVADTQTPDERLRRMQRLADAGRLPSQMIDTIGVAADERDASRFIAKMSEAISNRVDFDTHEILRLAKWSDSLGVESVTEAVLTYGEELHPTDEGIRRSLLSRLAESRSPDDRQAARERIAKLAGLDLNTGTLIDDSKNMGRADVSMIEFLTSSLHADGLEDVALSVCRAYVDAYPNRAWTLRLLGRAREWADDLAGGTLSMEAALKLVDVDDTTTTWLGNTFHNCGRHVDAVEMYLISSWLDPDDPKGYAHCAEELSFALFDPNSLYEPYSPVASPNGPRGMPETVGRQTVADFAVFALSIHDQSPEALRRVDNALRRAEFDSAEGAQLHERAQPCTRADRRHGVVALYEAVKSELSEGAPARARPMLSETFET